MTLAEKTRIRESLEYGDLAKAHAVLRDAEVKNPRTQQPYAYQTLQRQVLGFIENPALWEALQAIVSGRQKDAQKVRDHFKKQPIAA